MKQHLRQQALSESSVVYFSLQISGLELHDYLHQNQLQCTSLAIARVNFAFSVTAEETIPTTRCFYVRFS